LTQKTKTKTNRLNKEESTMFEQKKEIQHKRQKFICSTKNSFK